MYKTSARSSQDRANRIATRGSRSNGGGENWSSIDPQTTLRMKVGEIEDARERGRRRLHEISAQLLRKPREEVRKRLAAAQEAQIAENGRLEAVLAQLRPQVRPITAEQALLQAFHDLARQTLPREIFERLAIAARHRAGH